MLSYSCGVGKVINALRTRLLLQTKNIRVHLAEWVYHHVEKKSLVVLLKDLELSTFPFVAFDNEVQELRLLTFKIGSTWHLRCQLLSKSTNVKKQAASWWHVLIRSALPCSCAYMLWSTNDRYFLPFFVSIQNGSERNVQLLSSAVRDLIDAFGSQAIHLHSNSVHREAVSRWALLGIWLPFPSTCSLFRRKHGIVTVISAHASCVRKLCVEHYKSEDCTRISRISGISRLFLPEWGEVILDWYLPDELGQKAIGVVTVLQYCFLRR